MSIEVLINVPADFTVPDEPETAEERQLSDTMRRLKAQWTGDPQPGTRVHEGRKLILAIVHANLDELEAAIASYGYDWSVVGAKTRSSMIRTPKADDVLPFMQSRTVTDEEGNVTGYERPDHPRVGIYAGSIPWEYAS